MKTSELEQKYGKKLINKIMKEGFLNGCTIAITNGKDDIPEIDIILAIKEMGGKKIGVFEWDQILQTSTPRRSFVGAWFGRRITYLSK